MDATNCSAGFGEIIGVCDGIAQKTHDSEVCALTSWLHKALEGAHKPTTALVSFNMNHAERFDLLGEFVGAAIPAEWRARVEGEPACLIFDYSKSPTVLADGGADGVTVFGLPGESLKNRRVAICDEIKGKEKWVRLSDEIDVACLLVNATMAMNQTERTWLGECAPLFYENQPVVAMVGQQLLNSPEDAQAVSDAVNAALHRLQIHTQVFQQPQDALAYMDDFISREPVQQSHDRRVARNAVTAVGERAKAIMDMAMVGAAGVDAAVAQLEAQRQSLAMAAQLASDSILVNEFQRLKGMATEGIRDYGRQLSENIKAEVSTYPLDQLGNVDPATERYVIDSWNSFLQSMAATTETELEKVRARLTEQMEADAGTLIERLDEPTRRLVYSAITFGASPGAGNIGRDAIRTPAAYAGVNVGEIKGQLRRETRNMMLLSIPLLFVNPLMAVGNVIASSVIGKFRTEHDLKNARTDMTAQIDTMCSANAEAMVKYAEEGFDRQMQEGANNLHTAYMGLIGHLETDLNQLKGQQGQTSEISGFLDEQIRTVLPGLLAKI